MRTLLILLTALVAGSAVAGLTFIANGNVAAAGIAAIMAFGATAAGLHALVEP